MQENIWKFIYLNCGEWNESMIDLRSYSQNGQLPVGLIAQLVEHCTGIAEVMGSNPVQALISQLLKLSV